MRLTPFRESGVPCWSGAAVGMQIRTLSVAFVMLRQPPSVPCKQHAQHRVGCTSRPCPPFQQESTTPHRKDALPQRLLHAHAHALALSRQRRGDLTHRLQLHLGGLLRRCVLGRDNSSAERVLP